MILREGEKVKKRENGVIYEVVNIQDKGFVILKSEDGTRSVLMNMEDLDFYFTRVEAGLVERRSSL